MLLNGLPASVLAREVQDNVSPISLNCAEVFRDSLHAGPSLIPCRGGPLGPLSLLVPMCVLAEKTGDPCPVISTPHSAHPWPLSHWLAGDEREPSSRVARQPLPTLFSCIPTTLVPIERSNLFQDCGIHTHLEEGGSLEMTKSPVNRCGKKHLRSRRPRVTRAQTKPFLGCTKRLVVCPIGYLWDKCTCPWEA